MFKGVAFKRGFDSKRVIISGLIDMYGKIYDWRGVRNMFNEMSEHNIICWTSVSFTTSTDKNIWYY